jgi:hypothetical protein
VRIPALTAIVLPLLLIGCNGSPPPEPVAPPPVAMKKPRPKIEIPPALMTEGLEAIGAPFDKPVEYEVEGISTEKQIGTQETRVTVKNDQVIVAVDWHDGLEYMDNDRYVCDQKGVRANVAQGNILNPPFLYLPAKLSPGAKWKSYSEFVTSAGVRLKMDFDCKVIGTQKVTVPLGTYDAILVVQTGKVTSDKSINATQEGKNWFVKGIGMIKSTQVVKNLVGAKKTVTVTINATRFRE